MIRNHLTTAMRLFGLALVSAGLISCGSDGDGGGDTVVVPLDEVRLVCDNVTDSVTKLPLEGASVTYQTATGPKSTKTDANGDCELVLVAADVSGASNPAATVTLDGYEGQAYIFERLEGGNNYVLRNVSLVPLRTNVSIPAGGDTVWHLGDDFFSGAVNSQFQKAPDGTELSFEIADWAEKAKSYSKATIYLDHKGWQTAKCPGNTIGLSGDLSEDIVAGADSPIDGSWGGGANEPITRVFDVGAIGTTAKVVIKSATCTGGASVDLDDFEINRLRVVFSKN